MKFVFMEKVNIGLIGLGHLGRFHLENLMQIENCEVTGIYDIDKKKSKKFAKEFSVKPYDNMEDLLKDSDAVSIVTPTNTHYEIAKKALNSGVHLFIEKPMSETLSQAGEIVRIAKEKNLKVQVGHIERFNPAFLGLKKMKLNPLFIESHRLAEFNPRGTDVSVVLDLMIHDIDIIQNIVKSSVQSIDASGIKVISDSIDIANARIKFLNGTVANLTASRISTKKMRKMRIFQKNAYISIDFLEKKSEIFSIDSIEDLPDLNFKQITEYEYKKKNKSLLFSSPIVPDVNAIKLELTEFIDALIQNEDPPVTADDGYSNLRTAFEILKKIDE
ncbi:Gfo/Idh/MocA family protein [candidate division KSB1 bacterium]